MKLNTKWLENELKKQGCKINEITEEEVQIQDEQEWELIAEVFGKDYAELAKEKWEKIKK